MALAFDGKRAYDVALATTLLVALLPFQVAVALAVRFSSPGPVLYRATRVGRDGELFTMLKFRTMVVEAEQFSSKITGPRDPRITPVGRVLRATHFDELPQLWNVLRGDMSFVGPRPEDPRFVALYDAQQCAVLSVRPGITGQAQLLFRDESRLLTSDDPERDYVQRVLPAKLAVDMQYVRQQSLWRDLQIIIRTVVPLRR